MRLRIHRGAAEIGGNCIEVEASRHSILLDLGAPLMGDLSPEEALPPIRGLVDGTNPDLLGIVISHPHADHYGLAKLAHPSIPVYIGREADRLLRAAMAFGPFGAAFPNVVHYRHRKPFRIGPFRLTPYLNDHSAFDAYSFLVEADGKTLFYSGDIRGHGWKAHCFRHRPGASSGLAPENICKAYNENVVVDMFPLPRLWRLRCILQDGLKQSEVDGRLFHKWFKRYVGSAYHAAEYRIVDLAENLQ